MRQVIGGLRLFASDLGRVLAGVRAYFRYLLSRDLDDTSLGQLSAASGIAVPGRPNRYVVMVASARTEPQEVTLILDIYAIDSPTHPEGHYAYFSKRLTARPRTVTRVEIQYDWQATAGFVVDDRRAAADDFWRGTIERPARYAVSAVLLDARGQSVEMLTVYQELAS